MTTGSGCPHCALRMHRVDDGLNGTQVCRSCETVWIESTATAIDESASTEARRRSLQEHLIYSVSIPERIARSSIGMVAGLTREAASYAIPTAFQSSKSYEILITNSLCFLCDRVGRIDEDAAEDGEGSDEEFLARKAIGNFVDLAGLATLHVSPLWLLAIVSDVAYGSKVYVQELGEELKKQGVVAPDSVINHVDDVLEAVQNASGGAASMFDTPPLSVEQLKQSLDETRGALASVDYKRLVPESEIQRYWGELKGIASEEDQSLVGVSGAVTMHTLGRVSTVSKVALTGVQVVGGMMSRNVLRHYANAIDEVRDRGMLAVLSESARPYITGVWNNFESERETWTEQLLKPETYTRMLTGLKGLIPGRGSAESVESDRAASDHKPLSSPQAAPERP